MPDWYVRICAYDDLPECRQAIQSVPTGVPVHVCDGRYATFPGDYDLTPGLAEYCADRDHAHYHAPPADSLPFGHALDVPAEWRPGVHAKARWIDEVCPQDAWALKLDTDERLRTVDVDLDALDETVKYCPVVDLHEQHQQRVHVARLWVPDRWTRWIDDCLLPREIIPRDHPLECLQRIWRDDEWTALRFLRRSRTKDVRIDNYGGERPAAYRERRAEHLRRIGRSDRWTELKKEL